MNHWFLFFLCSTDVLNCIKECHNLEVRGLCVCLWKMVCVYQDESNKPWKPWILAGEMTVCEKRGGICRPCHKPVLVPAQVGRAVWPSEGSGSQGFGADAGSVGNEPGQRCNSLLYSKRSLSNSSNFMKYSCGLRCWGAAALFTCLFIYLLKHPGETVKPSLWGGWESDYGKSTLQWLSSH